MGKPWQLIININELGDIAFIDIPNDKTSLEALMVVNKAMNTFYRAAIIEEAKRTNQIPEEIQKLIDVVRKQRDPESN